MPATHRYSHPEGKGFGQHHAEADHRELPAEMRDLDMADGTEVEHAGTDEDRNLVIVAWTDKAGDARRTSIGPDFFVTYFEEI